MAELKTKCSGSATTNIEVQNTSRTGRVRSMLPNEGIPILTVSPVLWTLSISDLVGADQACIAKFFSEVVSIGSGRGIEQN